MSKKNYRFETLQLHVGQEQADPATDARAVPIYQTTSYVFRNSQHAADRFGLRDAGNIYGRLTNSTQGVFEDRVAALEGGVAGLAVASGAAAITYALQNILGAGDHLVAADNLYGGSYNLITHTLSTQGISNTIVNVNDLDALEAAIQPNTKVVFAETFGNPNSDVLNIEGVAAVAHRHNIPLIIDNTFGTPTSSDRWSTEPTSWCTPPPSSWAAMAHRSAVSSWTAESSTGKPKPINSPLSPSPTPPTMASSSPTPWGQQPSSPASVPCFFATQVPPSRLSTLSSCCKVWRR